MRPSSEPVEGRWDFFFGEAGRPLGVTVVIKFVYIKCMVLVWGFLRYVLRVVTTALCLIIIVGNDEGAVSYSDGTELEHHSSDQPSAGDSALLASKQPAY